MDASEATTCDTCGALVWQSDRHDDWHREIDRKLEAIALDLAKSGPFG